MDIFIEKVKLCPCLWDTNHLTYRDILKKNLTWERIARECGLTNGNEAKTQWKKLRDSHREALRRRKTPTGAHIKPWKYEILMEFLLPQTENRAASNDYRASIYNTSNMSDTNTDNNVMEAAPSQLLVSSVQSLPFAESDRKKQKKLLQQREQRREQRQIQRDGLRRKGIDIDRSGTQDALSNLFTSFCQKTRELPKFLQLRVQREIFDSVTRAEEEAMSFDSVNTCLSPTLSSSSSNEYAGANQDSPLPDSITVTQSSPIYASSPLPDFSETCKEEPEAVLWMEAQSSPG